MRPPQSYSTSGGRYFTYFAAPSSGITGNRSASFFRMSPVPGHPYPNRGSRRIRSSIVRITTEPFRQKRRTLAACRFQRHAVNSGNPRKPLHGELRSAATTNPCLAALERALYPGSISRPQSSFAKTPLPIRSTPFPPRTGLVERLPRDKLQIEAHPLQEILRSNP